MTATTLVLLGVIVIIFGGLGYTAWKFPDSRTAAQKREDSGW